MEVTFSSAAGSDHGNEDYVVAGPSWVVVLDGATPAPGVDSGCRHGVRWYVERLAGELARAFTTSGGMPLAQALADAIRGVRAAHDHTCDLGNPDSPSATVAMLRASVATVDYLVLSDAAVLLDSGGSVRCVSDDRLDHLPGYTVDVVAAHRNRPGGFWVASTLPEAAYEALTGSVPRRELRRAALLTDGAGRFVDLLGLGDWGQLLDALHDDGPAAVLRAVRAAETAQLGTDPRGRHGRRIKRHDDATAAYVVLRPA